MYSVDFQAFPTSEQQYWIMLETCCSMVDISCGHFHDSTALVTTKPQFTVINTLICKQLRQVLIHCLAQKQPGYQKKHLDTKTFFLNEMMFLKKKVQVVISCIHVQSCNKLYTVILQRISLLILTFHILISCFQMNKVLPYNHNKHCQKQGESYNPAHQG